MTGAEAPHLCFRSFVDALREDDDLVEINEEVDPYLEAAAIGRKVYETYNKAPLFNNLTGAHDDLFRVLAAPTGLRSPEKGIYGRLARHLGLPPHASMKELTDKVLTGRGQAAIPPNVVDSGPCKQNKKFGDQVDLSKVPKLWLHGADGGAYIQTYGMHVLKTPDGNWTNWSISRAMIHDKRHLVGLVTPPQHIWQIWKMWKDIGQDVPWALAIGVPPAAIIVAGQPIPEGITEAEYIGAMTGQALDLVRCETNDLLVPANSEIVFEGTLSTTETGLEGPFGEIHGYTWPGKSAPNPLYTVNAITYRDDPIVPMVVAGRAVEENHTIVGLTVAAEIRQLCQGNGLPVKEVFIPYETHCVWAAVQIDLAGLQKLHTTPAEFCNRIGSLVFSTKCSWMVGKILLVADDIDPFSFSDILWVYSTRCRPGMNEYVFEGDDVRACALLPYMSHGPGEKRKGGKQVCDCLFPAQYTGNVEWETADFAHAYPIEIQQKVERRWKQLGFDV